MEMLCVSTRMMEMRAAAAEAVSGVEVTLSWFMVQPGFGNGNSTALCFESSCKYVQLLALVTSVKSTLA
jgi:hypothetical protein